MLFSFAENYDESIIDEYKTVIDELKQLHASRADIYNAFTEWNTLWSEKIAYEARQNDPDRFKNRGGNLQRELQVCARANCVINCNHSARQSTRNSPVTRSARSSCRCNRRVAPAPSQRRGGVDSRPIPCRRG
jgi:hypothetical protein